MAMSSSSPSDPPSTITTTTTTTTVSPRPSTNPSVAPPQQRYSQPNQYTLASLPNVSPRPNQPQLPQFRDSPEGILYTVASSGRGFLPKSVRADQTVTITNPVGGFSARSVAPIIHPVRSFGSDPVNHSSPHVARHSNHLQHTLLGAIGAAMPGVGKGAQFATNHSKVSTSPPLPISESNGYKDARDKSRDDCLAIVRDRKVRITDGASLYALCRSWLRNGLPEESQPQYIDGVKALPRPLPLSVGEANSPLKAEDDKEEEQGNDVDLSPQELLQRHIKRAKRVRSRLREERLKRIARYKTRLALLLPPIIEQPLRNDTAS